MAARAKTSKAVILARGLGTRMRRLDETVQLSGAQAAAADVGLKAMIPVGGGRPFIDYVLSALADAGITDACLVIGPEHTAVRGYYTATSPPERVRIHFAEQARPIGTANAVLAAEQFIGADPFLVLNSDNYTRPMLRQLAQPAPALPAFSRAPRCWVTSAEPVAKYALLEFRGTGACCVSGRSRCGPARGWDGAPVSMNVAADPRILWRVALALSPS
jgi:glucose-1-phosphate thymidylyltransferase